jgi:hypothetical protein
LSCSCNGLLASLVDIVIDKDGYGREVVACLNSSIGKSVMWPKRWSCEGVVIAFHMCAGRAVGVTRQRQRRDGLDVKITMSGKRRSSRQKCRRMGIRERDGAESTSNWLVVHTTHPTTPQQRHHAAFPFPSLPPSHLRPRPQAAWLLAIAPGGLPSAALAGVVAARAPWLWASSDLPPGAPSPAEASPAHQPQAPPAVFNSP